MRKLGALCSMVLTVALFGVCMSVVAIRALGMGTFVVTGASMEPTIHKGSLVIVEPVAPSAVQRGDVITFQHYGQTTTHRVIAVDRTNPNDAVFTTQGDANAVADPEPVHFPGQVGLFRASVPLAGYIVAYGQAYWRLALMVIAGLVFFGCAATLLFRKDERRAPARRGLPEPVAIDPDALWVSHIGWLRERTAQRIRVA